MKGGAHEDEDAAVQRKIQNMRTKLSMAKQMLEELLAERDEMDRVHGEEMQQLEDSLQAGEEEKDHLKDEILNCKAQLHRLDNEADRDDSIFELELAKVNREEATLRKQIAEENQAHLRVKEQLWLLAEAARTEPEPEPIAEIVVPPAVVVEPEQLREQQHHDDTEEEVAEEEVAEEEVAEEEVAEEEIVEEEVVEEEVVEESRDAAHAEEHTLDDEGDEDEMFQSSPQMISNPLEYSGTPVSAMKSGRGKRKNGCRVKFDMVCVRGFAVELGGGGGVPLDGSPLGLGWSFENQDPVRIDDWEQVREPVRIYKDNFMRQGYIPPEARREKLRALGFDDDELDSSADIVRELQASRKESNDELEPDKELVATANAFMWWWMCAQGLDSYLDT